MNRSIDEDTLKHTNSSVVMSEFGFADTQCFLETLFCQLMLIDAGIQTTQPIQYMTHLYDDVGI